MFTRKLRLVGYVRTAPGAISQTRQVETIKDYCLEHGHKLIGIHTDEGEPGLGLADSFAAMAEADGMIAYDATRLIAHPADSLRELRPLLKTKFMQTHKYIITIVDGIENFTPAGQANIIELMNDWTRRDEMQVAAVDLDNSSFGANI